MATTGAHPNAGHAPDTRCVFPEQTPRNVTGVLQPAFSGISRRSFGSRRPRALDCRPPPNPPTPAYPRSVRDRSKTRACARGCVRRPRRRRETTRAHAGNAHASGRGGADTRRDAVGGVRSRRASRRRSTHRGDGFERQLSGLKDRDPRSKRRSTRSRARGLPPRFFWVKRASRVFFLFSCFSCTSSWNVDSAVAHGGQSLT